MTSQKVPEFFTNQNYITDDLETAEAPKPPKKNLKSAFDLIHPTFEEELAKKELELQNLKITTEKIQNERFNRYKILLYSVSILGLFFFSYKRWFPLLRGPIF